MNRIQRLLNAGQSRTNPSLNWLTVGVTLGLVVSLAVPFLRQSVGAQQSSETTSTSTAPEIRITLVGDVTPQFGSESFGFEVGNPDSYAVFEVVQNGESRRMDFVSYETPQGSRERTVTRSKQFLNGAENTDNWIGWFVDYMNQINFLEVYQSDTIRGVATGKNFEDGTTFTVLQLKDPLDFEAELEYNGNLREKLAKQALDHGVIDEAGYRLLVKTGSSD